MGNRKKVYNRLNRSSTRGRAVMQYRMARYSEAMYNVMQDCNFSGVDGIRADTGIMSNSEAARRWAQDAPLDEQWSLMRWTVSQPGWHRPLDGEQGCDGGKVIHYVSRGCPELPDFAGMTNEQYDEQCPIGERIPGIFTKCAPGGGEINIDRFTHLGFQEGYRGTQLPIIDTPVCPPYAMNPTAKRVWQRMADDDRVRSRMEPEGFHDYLDSFVDLHYWGYPVWIGMFANGVVVQPVKRGQWVILHEGVFFDDYRNRNGEVGVDPPDVIEDLVLGAVAVVDGIVGVPEDGVDQDEARDLCFD